jgi:hypothetical protein
MEASVEDKGRGIALQNLKKYGAVTKPDMTLEEATSY